MIQMQRSSSLPGSFFSSPPLSPTITQGLPSNAPPTPLHLSSRRQWLLGPDTQATPLPTHRIIPQERVPVENAALPSKSPVSAGKSIPFFPGRNTQRRPLLQDAAQYTSKYLRDVARASPSTSLEELAHLVRLSRYQGKKRVQSRARLQRSLVSTALSARLVRCGELAHRALVDNFRADDKKAFAMLYNALHDVTKSCDATRHYTLLEPELDLLKLGSEKVESVTPFSTFMHDIPAQSREILLHFVTQIRTNPEFLATRISSLTAVELAALTTFHQGLEPVDSVLPFHSRSKAQSVGSNRTSSLVASAVERLLSFQRHDPLSALIHTCFANSAGSESAEDIRRTEVWATVCAKLIAESKAGLEAFLCNVLNVWTNMREWSGRGNMEWYLMKILEDGAFLLEKAEDQAGTRIHVEPWNTKDSIAAEDFYDSAVKGLFELIDDPGAGGIPEGLLELGTAILRKVDTKRQTATRRFLVSKWLFGVFLLNAVIHPESYGMMSEYHITEYGRQKILKEVAMRAQRQVVDVTWKHSAAVVPEIRVHIENIMGQFRTGRNSAFVPKLLPARSITSLRETAEVHPYIVLSPSDIVTLVNALFPERRPTSGGIEKDGYLSAIRPGSSLVSGIANHATPPPLSVSTFDTASIISNSGSSVFSDPTSREPIFDDASIGTHRFSTTSISSMSQAAKFDDDGYRLRMALREMSHALGHDVTAGSCHPCAEQWAVLFMTSDGQTLSIQMDHDDDDMEEEEDNSSSSNSEDEFSDPRSDLDKDYHQLRDSILRLVEDYDIPQTSDSKDGAKVFSNISTTSVGCLSKRHRSRFNQVNPDGIRDDRNDSPPQELSAMETNPIERGSPHQSTKTGVLEEESVLSTKNTQSLLLQMLESAESQCRAQSDFITAHLYWRTLQQLHQISSQTLRHDGYASLLNIFSRGPRDSIRHSAVAIEEHEAWLVWLKLSQERHDMTVDSMMQKIRSLRDKMWYVTDVRNSAAYEGARNVAVALKTMGTSNSSRYQSMATPRPRNLSRSSATNFLLKTEAQVLDILAASDEHGGPNKLSDDQSDKTKKWLSQYEIHNFCKGEERIHRFCLEIDTCINKLVGDSLVEGPVLWSSELYHRDKVILDSGREKGDLIVTGLGTLGISGDMGHESESSRRGSSMKGVDMTSTSRGLATDLRAMALRNGSQQSLDSSRWNRSRTSLVGDIMDSQEYFGLSSPLFNIDSTKTFWTPLQAGTQLISNNSNPNLRPGTASTTGETILSTTSGGLTMTPRKKFLTDLKAKLASLLLSDLGTLVFARGSETDVWFTGDLGRQCREKQEEQTRRSRKKKKDRVLEKKKSFHDLRSAQNLGSPLHVDVQTLGNTIEKSNVKNSSVSKQSSIDIQYGGDSFDHDDVWNAPTDDANSSLPLLSDFPYKEGFKRLLKMFSVHPNPYAKLNALHELELLIVASLISVSPKRTAQRDYTGSDLNRHVISSGVTTRHPPKVSRWTQGSPMARDADGSSASRNSDDHSIASLPVASADMIITAFQELFREARMIPKTLFRDLQFIAAFVPATILDKTDKGKAFWDAGLAALDLKEGICRTMIEIADEIVSYYTDARQASAMAVSKDRDPFKDKVMKFSMQDAAKMWIITAKEGDPVAERELAIFYLTHPELVDRTTQPLTKPSETFKVQVMEMHSKDGDRERSDPATMCNAFHWMERSAQGGDELAKKYLRQRDELNDLP